MSRHETIPPTLDLFSVPILREAGVPEEEEEQVTVTVDHSPDPGRRGSLGPGINPAGASQGTTRVLSHISPDFHN